YPWFAPSLKFQKTPGLALTLLHKGSSAIVSRIAVKQTREKESNKHVESHQQTPRGLHPRGNHDRGCDHRITRGDCRAWVPPGAQTFASQPYPERSAHDRLSG